MSVLREAESNGVRCRWNPERPPYYRAEVWEDSSRWRCATDDEKIDHAAVFATLREQPYATEVDSVVEAISEWLRAVVGPHHITAEAREELASTIRPLVLASTPTDDLVGELVKRGGRKTANLMYGTDKTVIVLQPEPTR